MSKVVAAYRVRNEGRWIGESLERALEIADEAIVFDDHSTDSTCNVVKSFSRATLYHSNFSDENEARDREMVVQMAVAAGAQWILSLDGDEVLTPTAARFVKRVLEKDRRAAWFFRVAYLWNEAGLERVDGCYANICAPILWGVHSRDPKQLAFARTVHGTNFHCGRLPADYFFPSYYADADALIKHYGYMLSEDRERKHAFYVDKDNDEGRALEGGYDHILGLPSRRAPGPVALRPFKDE